MKELNEQNQELLQRFEAQVRALKQRLSASGPDRASKLAQRPLEQGKVQAKETLETLQSELEQQRKFVWSAQSELKKSQEKCAKLQSQALESQQTLERVKQEAAATASKAKGEVAKLKLKAAEQSTNMSLLNLRRQHDLLQFTLKQLYANILAKQIKLEALTVGAGK